MKLIQITDLHLVPAGGRILGIDPAARLRDCIDDINAHHADADLVVLTGDLANNGEPGAYDILDAELARLRVPFRLTLGNHDDRAEVLARHPGAADGAGFAQSVWDGPGGRVILADTLQTGAVEGHLCAARLSVLDGWMASAPGPVWLFLHHPPMALGMPALDRVRLDAPSRAALLSLAQRHGRIAHIAAGHVHRPSAGQWYGIPVTTLRSTCHQTAFQFEDRFASVPEPPAYAVFVIGDEGAAVHFHDFPTRDLRA
ncbi:phosphodiesterase [Halodurantibacterium flavum]|uniref:Phosphodiesterase n=1 Tax=Halodurantibacterium flavum TaxID=1382802 RepID=A0ABW4RZM5_9RHOB